jgi:hypothetical protein
MIFAILTRLSTPRCTFGTLEYEVKSFDCKVLSYVSE